MRGILAKVKRPTWLKKDLVKQLIKYQKNKIKASFTIESNKKKRLLIITRAKTFF